MALTQEEARVVARETVHETLLMLGIDVSTPEAIRQAQSDFAFTRNSRLAGEAFKANAVRVVFWLIGTGVIGFVSWLAASIQWRGHP